ncbi:hypothetical protein KHC28_01330 [Ancylobacter sonchi]|uniref:hypothetical protein n=1 Tax=Ancylobacter sonchi TaxID=1937790 RepID=UPI001BD3675E|nr:hypothetical protein [Ancylobacter sonchi]MBS7532295.1 hypothetical protein [Ancylobacter sonchi]
MYGIAAEGQSTALQQSPSIDVLLAWARDNLKPNGAILVIVNMTTGQRALTGKAGTGWSRNRDAVSGGAPYDYQW